MPGTYTKEFLLELLEQLMLVRFFEERLFTLYKEDLVYGTIHLGVGEEATGVGAMAALKEEDCILATHRGHVQALAKGVDPGRMMAEMLGRTAGTNRGFGGSMHTADFSKGMLGQYGIVGANTPIACGAALAMKLRHEADRVAAVFFGDGACNEGAVHESMNLASLWGLPLLFICINNGYGLSTPVERASAEPMLSRRAAAYGMKYMEVDGNDVLAMISTVSAARAYVLSEAKPMLILARSYRTSGHSKEDPNLYRDAAEIADWEANNPVRRFTETLMSMGIYAEEIEQVRLQAIARMEAAVRFALEAEKPAFSEAALLNAVYAGGGAHA